MCTSPRTKHALGGSSRKRVCSSSASSAPADSASHPSPFPAVPYLDPRVRRVQPGTGHAAQGWHAARAVARHSSPPRHQPGLQVGARRRLRAGPGGQLAVGGVRGAGPVSRGLHGVADGRREERQPRAGHPPLRRLRQGRREREAEDDLGADLPGVLLVLSLVVVVDHRAEGRAGVRRLLRAVRAGAAALDAGHRRGLGLRRNVLPGSWSLVRRFGAGVLVVVEAAG